MLQDTFFSLSNAGILQILAFVGFCVATIAFFVWVAILYRE